MKKLNLIFTTILSAVLLVIPIFVFAAETGAFHLVICGTIVENNVVMNPCTICDLFVGINTIIRFITLYLATPLCIIAFLVGGFWILVSGDSPDKRTKGKDAITYALLGMLFIFGAYLVINLILGNLIDENYKWTDAGNWGAFPSCATWGK